MEDSSCQLQMQLQYIQGRDVENIRISQATATVWLNLNHKAKKKSMT